MITTETPVPRKVWTFDRLGRFYQNGAICITDADYAGIISKLNLAESVTLTTEEREAVGAFVRNVDDMNLHHVVHDVATILRRILEGQSK